MRSAGKARRLLTARQIAVDILSHKYVNLSPCARIPMAIFRHHVGEERRVVSIAAASVSRRKLRFRRTRGRVNGLHPGIDGRRACLYEIYHAPAFSRQPPLLFTLAHPSRASFLFAALQQQSPGAIFPENICDVPALPSSLHLPDKLCLRNARRGARRVVKFIGLACSFLPFRKRRAECSPGKMINTPPGARARKYFDSPATSSLVFTCDPSRDPSQPLI